MKKADLVLWGLFVLLLALASLAQDRLGASRPPVAASPAAAPNPS